MTTTDTFVPKVTMPTMENTGEYADLPEDPDVETEIAPDEPLVDDIGDLIEIPVHGVATISGKPTGDKRMFARDGVTYRPLPLPMRYEFVGTHGGDTSMVAPVGRIDELYPFDAGDYIEHRFRGVIITTKAYANEALEGIVDGSLTGVSVEVDDLVLEDRKILVADDASMDEIAAAMDELEQMPDVFSAARVCGFTIVPIPAYYEGFLALGHAFPDELTDADQAALAACGCAGVVADSLDAEPEALVASARTAEFAPGTKDGPGWVTNPTATARIRRYWVHGKGALKIKWGVPGDFNRCRTQLAKYVQNPDWLAGLCANMHKEALGVWPGQEGGKGLVASAAPAPLFSLTASSATTEISHSLFERPEFLSARDGCVIDGDHVYGYVATWGICHIGIDGVCTTAPASNTNYGLFAAGVVDTDLGEVRVGQITLDTGHADGHLAARPAASHYDNTGTVVADVAIGEDGTGIWYSGRIRPWATEEQRFKLKASGGLSGDWRWWPETNSLELVAALAVNSRGFHSPQLVASAGHQVSLIAAGMVQDVPSSTAGRYAFSAEEVAGLVRTAVSEVRHQEKREARLAALEPERAAARAAREQRARDLRDRVDTDGV